MTGSSTVVTCASSSSSASILSRSISSPFSEKLSVTTSTVSSPPPLLVILSLSVSSPSMEKLNVCARTLLTPTITITITTSTLNATTQTPRVHLLVLVGQLLLIPLSLSPTLNGQMLSHHTYTTRTTTHQRVLYYISRLVNSYTCLSLSLSPFVSI